MPLPASGNIWLSDILNEFGVQYLSDAGAMYGVDGDGGTWMTEMYGASATVPTFPIRFDWPYWEAADFPNDPNAVTLTANTATIDNGGLLVNLYEIDPNPITVLLDLTVSVNVSGDRISFQIGRIYENRGQYQFSQSSILNLAAGTHQLEFVVNSYTYISQVTSLGFEVSYPFSGDVGSGGSALIENLRYFVN